MSLVNIAETQMDINKREEKENMKWILKRGTQGKVEDERRE